MNEEVLLEEWMRAIASKDKALGPATFVLSAPYPEGSIVKLSNFLEREGYLQAAYSPSRSVARLLTRALKSVLSVNTVLRLSRGNPASPSAREIMPLLEVGRLAARLPVIRSIAPRAGEPLKRAFDRGVARRLPSDVPILVGMPGACLATFYRAERSIKIFHEVDAHPLARNKALAAHYGTVARAECVSTREVSNIIAELSEADFVLSPSTVVTDQLVLEGVPKHSVIQVPYGIDVETFVPKASDSARSEKVHFLYVGQISYRKGIPFLVEAARGAQFTVELIGPVVAERLLKDLPANVTHRGPLAHELLAEKYATADALVLPSIEDNFALVVLEALAAGLPVITTSAVGASEVLGSGDGRVIPPGDIEALRSAMSEQGVLAAGERDHRAQVFRKRLDVDGQIYSWEGYSRAVLKGLMERLESANGQ